MITKDLKGKMIYISSDSRNWDIFKYVKPLMGEQSENGGSYLKNKTEFYIKDEAKKVIYSYLVDGLNAEEQKEAHDFVTDLGAFSVGRTLAAHAIETKQRGCMKDIENAKEIIDAWIDNIEDRMEY